MSCILKRIRGGEPDHASADDHNAHRQAAYGTGAERASVLSRRRGGFDAFHPAVPARRIKKSGPRALIWKLLLGLGTILDAHGLVRRELPPMRHICRRFGWIAEHSSPRV
jgi:hypothetical protein